MVINLITHQYLTIKIKNGHPQQPLQRLEEYCKFNLQTTTMAKSKKSLAETHPELVKEWHPTKNGTLTPQDVTHGKEIKVW